jgi:hypothetical protein
MGRSLRRPCPAVEQPRAAGWSDRERASVRDTGIVSADTPVDETGCSYIASKNSLRSLHRCEFELAETRLGRCNLRVLGD